MTWRRASACYDAACVEVARLGCGCIRVRNSSAPERMVTFTRAEWVAFVAGVKAGEFDDLTGGGGE